MAGGAEIDKLIFDLESFLRHRGAHAAILAVDEVVLREDLAAEAKQAQVQAIIKEVLRG